MRLLGKATIYGIYGMMELAKGGDGHIRQLQEIADARGIPPHFLAKVFQQLVKQGLLQSHRGQVRGYSLTRGPGAITLREVVETMEGPLVTHPCMLADTVDCPGDPECLLQAIWTRSVMQLLDNLDQFTLADLVNREVAWAA